VQVHEKEIVSSRRRFKSLYIKEMKILEKGQNSSHMYQVHLEVTIRY
jgi:hypothetical protein